MRKLIFALVLLAACSQEENFKSGEIQEDTRTLNEQHFRRSPKNGIACIKSYPWAYASNGGGITGAATGTFNYKYYPVRVPEPGLGTGTKSTTLTGKITNSGHTQIKISIDGGPWIVLNIGQEYVFLINVPEILCDVTLAQLTQYRSVSVKSVSCPSGATRWSIQSTITAATNGATLYYGGGYLTSGFQFQSGCVVFF